MEPTTTPTIDLEAMAERGAWAIHPEWMGKVRATLAAHENAMGPTAAQFPEAKSSRSGTIAIVDVAGPLTKRRSMFSMLFGGSSMLDLQALIQELADDDEIGGIMLRIDSPGGTVSGTSELADAVRAANEIKPVHAYITDMGASAAYWIASQTGRISADSDAIVGSVGTLIIADDYSKMFEEAGVTRHVVATGSEKGIGVMGRPITKDHLASLQRHVDQLFEVFSADVQRGRGLSAAQMKLITDASIHVGKHALKVGLIDAVESFEEAVQHLATIVVDSGAQSQTPRRAATVAETAEGALNMEPAVLTQAAGGAVSVASGAPAPAAPAQPAASTPSATPAPQTPASPVAAPVNPSPVADIATLQEQARAAERARCKEIRTIAQTMGLSDQWAEAMIDSDSSADVVRANAIEAFGQNRNGGVSEVRGDIRVGVDRNVDSFVQGVQDGLCLRAGVPIVEFDRKGKPVREANGSLKLRPAHGRAEEFGAMSLMDMAKGYLNLLGVDTVGMAPNTIAQSVFHPKLSMPFDIRGGGMAMLGTSDFPSLLAAVTNKSLQISFAKLPSTHRVWTRRRTARDFKPINSLKVISLGALDQVLEHGEYTHVTVGEEKETYQLAKYGNLFAITWETLVNDDLGVFNQIPMWLASAAEITEGDLVYSILIDNPDMADEIALFHTSHANTQGTKVDLNVAGLAVARKFMREQTLTDDQGKTIHLNITPRYLICGPELETAAEQTIGAQFDTSKSNDITPNPFRTLVPVIEPRITGKKWTVAADPSVRDTVEVCYLEGAEAPSITQADSSNIDGRTFKVRHVVAAKAADWRGMVQLEAN